MPIIYVPGNYDSRSSLGVTVSSSGRLVVRGGELLTSTGRALSGRPCVWGSMVMSRPREIECSLWLFLV